MLTAPSVDHGRGAPEADALIAEARRRRRRRWLAGLLVVALAAAAAATWFGRDGSDRSGRNAGAPGASLVAATSCASAHAYGPLPVWARSGFHPANLAVPYVLGAHHDIVAVLWARHGALHAPPLPGRNNKILWVSRLPVHALANLDISARRLAGGRAVGPIVRRRVVGGPGPSGIDMPRAGCWRFTLRWSGHRDTVDLSYAKPPR